MEIKNTDSLELWKDALRYIITHGENYIDNEGRVCREVQNLVLVLDAMQDEVFELPINNIIEKKMWIYPSKEELTNIMLKEFQAPIYDYTYGGRIFNFSNEKDQLRDFIIPLLNQDPRSRRAVLIFYDPKIDSNVNNKNSPGIMYMQFRMIDSKLQVTCAIRSNDLFFGWPANLYQMHVIQKMVAQELGVQVGSLITISNSAHFFIDDIEHIEKIVGVK